MTWDYKAVPAIVLTLLIAAPPERLLGQQSALQTAFLAPTSLRLSNPIPRIVDSEHLSYLKQLAKDKKLSASAFKPNSSDLLIQQAEERFSNGRKFYQERDFDRARVEFDAAIDDMLTASDNPTDPRLFESRLEDMVDRYLSLFDAVMVQEFVRPRGPVLPPNYLKPQQHWRVQAQYNIQHPEYAINSLVKRLKIKA